MKQKILFLVTLVFISCLIAGCGTPPIAQWQATYCLDKGCVGMFQVLKEGYIYDLEDYECPQTQRILKYLMPVGKALIPVYETYYIKEGTCVLTHYQPETPNQ